MVQTEKKRVVLWIVRQEPIIINYNLHFTYRRRFTNENKIVILIEDLISLGIYNTKYVV